MLGRQPLLALVLLGGFAGLAGLAAPASAHCPDGAQETVVAGISTCPANEHLEQVVDRLNAASDDDEVFVLVKDLSFHPPVVELADEGTVVFVWGDVDHENEHDPQSSGAAGDGCEEAWQDPVACEPVAPGVCFSIEQVMNEAGDTYEVTLRTDAEGNVEVSESAFAGEPLLGQPPFSPAFVDCPDGTATPHPTDDDRVVVPFHCGFHGLESTPVSSMRGAILLEQ